MVLLPLDTSELIWQDYIREMPWLTLSPTSREPIARLFLKFNVTEIPRLVIIDRFGQLVSPNARGLPSGFGFGCDAMLAYQHLLDSRPPVPHTYAQPAETAAPEAASQVS